MKTWIRLNRRQYAFICITLLLEFLPLFFPKTEKWMFSGFFAWGLWTMAILSFAVILAAVYSDELTHPKKK